MDLLWNSHESEVMLRVKYSSWGPIQLVSKWGTEVWQLSPHVGLHYYHHDCPPLLIQGHRDGAHYSCLLTLLSIFASYNLPNSVETVTTPLF